MIIVITLLASACSIHASKEPFKTKNELEGQVDNYCADPHNYDSASYGDINDWDVTRITNMDALFRNQNDCNPDISAWDVGNVKGFKFMFALTGLFNADISGWDVSSGNVFGGMFFGSESFNVDISGWNVSSGTAFNIMFNKAASFHQDLTSWPTLAKESKNFCVDATCDEASTTSPTTPRPTTTPSPTTAPSPEVTTPSPTTAPSPEVTPAPTSRTTSIPTTTPSPTTAASLEVTPAQYILSPPDCKFDTGDVTFTCTFHNIISPTDASVSMQILHHDCITAYDSTLFDNTAVTADTPQVTGATSFDAVANIDPSSGYEGDIPFCIRTDLKDKTGVIMIYRSEKVKVTLTYNGSFSVTGLATNAFAGINDIETTATKTFGVTSSVCDSTGTPITSPPALSIGDTFFACIETNVVGTVISSITSFTAQKGTTADPYDVTAHSQLVVIRGVDSSKVKVHINLPASFFEDTDEIVLSGSVVVSHGSSTRRRRLASPNDENALDDIVFDDAWFQFLIDVNVNNDDSSSISEGTRMMSSTTIIGLTTLSFFMLLIILKLSRRLTRLGRSSYQPIKNDSNSTTESEIKPVKEQAGLIMSLT